MTQAFQNAATRTIQVKDTRMVYRELGERGGVPVVFLHHLTAVLDDWDPKVLDGIAGSHHVVIFDNRGVGGSGGQTPRPDSPAPFRPRGCSHAARGRGGRSSARL